MTLQIIKIAMHHRTKRKSALPARLPCFVELADPMFYDSGAHDGHDVFFGRLLRQERHVITAIRRLITTFLLPCVTVSPPRWSHRMQ